MSHIKKLTYATLSCSCGSIKRISDKQWSRANLAYYYPTDSLINGFKKLGELESAMILAVAEATRFNCKLEVLK